MFSKIHEKHRTGVGGWVWWESPRGSSKEGRDTEEGQLNWPFPRSLQRSLCHHNPGSLGPASPLEALQDRNCLQTLYARSGAMRGVPSANRPAFPVASLHLGSTNMRSLFQISFPVHLCFPEQAYLSRLMCGKCLFLGAGPLCPSSHALEST